MFIKPLTPYHTYIIDYYSLGYIKKATGLSTNRLKRILREAPFPVYRFPAGTRYRYLVEKKWASHIILAHGTPEARKRRRAEYDHRLRGPRITVACPRCGDTEPKRRGGFTSAGHRVLFCHGCQRHFTHHEQPASSSPSQPSDPPTSCPRCHATARQWKHGITSRGLQCYQCSACRKCHTPGSPERPPLRGKCPACGETIHHYRHHVSAAGNLNAECSHCGHKYVVLGNPDRTTREPIPHVLPPAPNPHDPFARFTPPRGTFDW